MILAARFYEHVIGWSSQPFGAGSGYTLFSNEQGPHAGTTELPKPARDMGAPPHWTSNVHVANVDVTAARAKKLGGEVLAEGSDFPNVGRVAVIADRDGASINLFTPPRPMSARDRQKPGEFVWNELLANDQNAAFAFYAELFGWKKSKEVDLGPMGTYLIYGNGERDLGGMFTLPKPGPAHAAWLYYIEVTDLDAALARAKSKGARVLNGPMQVPDGARIVQLADPQGAAFALHEAKKS